MAKFDKILSTIMIMLESSEGGANLPPPSGATDHKIHLACFVGEIVKFKLELKLVQWTLDIENDPFHLYRTLLSYK